VKQELLLQSEFGTETPFQTYILLGITTAFLVSTMEDKEPIAIVGLSCRFPGEAENPQGFFEMLVRGESAWSELPKSRFDIDAYYHPSVDRDGTVSRLIFSCVLHSTLTIEDSHQIWVLSKTGCV
jgi:hypothetical protein